MNISLKDNNNNIILSDKVFNVKFNMSLVHQIIKSYKINYRKGNSCQKSRSDVSGSNRKPWRQKGTGRARSGSVKSPIWRSGGVTFASKNRKYFSKVNRKMYCNALKSVLSELLRQSRLHILNDFSINLPKTKFLIEKLRILKFVKLLIVIKKFDNNLFLASRNLYNVRVCDINNINIIDLINYKDIIFTYESIKIIEGRLLNGK